MPELKKKGRKRSSNPNRNVATLQATVLIYLDYHPFGLQEHLLTACKTSGAYLNDYILNYLLKQNQITKETARNKKSFKLTDEGKEYAKNLKAAGVPVKYTCYQGQIHALLSCRGALEQEENPVDEIGAVLSEAVE